MREKVNARHELPLKATLRCGAGVIALFLGGTA
jgi:hypothetical protein